jgi:hypothetical protein
MSDEAPKQLTIQQATDAQAALSTLDKIAESLGEMTPEQRSEAVQQLIQDSVASDHKPKTWKPRTVATYYTRQHALWVKEHLDKLLANKGDDLILERKRFMLSTNSLYLKVSQAWMWLRENHEPIEERTLYVQLKRFVEVKKSPGRVTFRWRAPVRDFNEVDEKAQLASSMHSEKNWKEEFDNFCESAQENEKFEKKVDLGGEDMQYIRDSLVGAEGFHIIKLQKDWVMILFKKENIPV